jgi:hypothetical protein
VGTWGSRGAGTSRYCGVCRPTYSTALSLCITYIYLTLGFRFTAWGWGVSFDGWHPLHPTRDINTNSDKTGERAPTSSSTRCMQENFLSLGDCKCSLNSRRRTQRYLEVPRRISAPTYLPAPPRQRIPYTHGKADGKTRKGKKKKRKKKRKTLGTQRKSAESAEHAEPAQVPRGWPRTRSIPLPH